MDATEYLEHFKQEKETYANTFSEGSLALKQLLLNLWSNDIATVGCCAGHGKEPVYYKIDLRGRPTSIDEETYQKHKFSPFYRKGEEERLPYIAFEIKDQIKRHELAEKLRDEFKSIYDVSVQENNSFNTSISIVLNKNESSLTRDNFFKSISAFADKHLFPHRMMNQSIDPKIPQIKKPLLEQIATAELKSFEQQFHGRNSPDISLSKNNRSTER